MTQVYMGLFFVDFFGFLVVFFSLVAASLIICYSSD